MYRHQQVQPIPLDSQPFLLAVAGEGEITISPKAAVVNLGVITEGNDVQPIQQQNSITMNNVIQVLVRLGIPHEHIQTFDYRIDSIYDFEHGKQLLRGYKVVHLLQVTMDDLSQVGRIIDSAVEQGANYVANVHFSAGSYKEIYRKALSLSIKDAQDKAKTIASSLKISLLPTPVYIIEGSEKETTLDIHPGTYVKGLSSTTFEPGQLKVKALVNVYFRFQP